LYLTRSTSEHMLFNNFRHAGLDTASWTWCCLTVYTTSSRARSHRSSWALFSWTSVPPSLLQRFRASGSIVHAGNATLRIVSILQCLHRDSIFLLCNEHEHERCRLVLCTDLFQAGWGVRRYA